MEFGDVYHLPVFNTRRPDWQVLGDFQVKLVSVFFPFIRKSDIY